MVRGCLEGIGRIWGDVLESDVPDFPCFMKGEGAVGFLFSRGEQGDMDLWDLMGV
jgi:hypothetical protein